MEKTKDRIGFWFAAFCTDTPDIMMFGELPPDADAATFDLDATFEIVRVGKAQIKITSDDLVISRAADPRRWPEGTFLFSDSCGTQYELELFDNPEDARERVDEHNDSPGIRDLLDEISEQEYDD